MKAEKTNASKSKTVLFFINVTVFIAMIIHIAIKTDLHLQHPEYSAPAAVELLNALYYIIPLSIFDIVFLHISRRNNKTNKKSKTTMEEPK